MPTASVSSPISETYDQDEDELRTDGTNGGSAAAMT